MTQQKQDKLTLFQETTQKDPEETAVEIQRLLKGYNLKSWFLDFDNGNIVGAHFSIIVNGEELGFRLPVNHLSLWEKAQNKQTRYIKTESQARRVAWRQVFRLIQSQLAFVDTGTKNIIELFFSDMLVKDNKTAFQLFLEQKPALKAG